MSDASIPAATLEALHRVAVHVLARRRAEVSGRIGLRATPGGFGTPSFGSPEVPEVLRVAGSRLVREIGGEVTTMRLDGSTLALAASFAGADLGAPFDAGQDTPPVGDTEALLSVDDLGAAALGAWFDLGWRALDVTVADAETPTAVQLWPEHFDAGCSVAVGPDADDRCNLGVSAGDAGVPEPYLYIGPWGAARPGDAAYWNAPFGAVLPRSGVRDGAQAVAFLRDGVDRLRSRR